MATIIRARGQIQNPPPFVPPPPDFSSLSAPPQQVYLAAPGGLHTTEGLVYELDAADVAPGRWIARAGREDGHPIPVLDLPASTQWMAMIVARRPPGYTGTLLYAYEYDANPGWRASHAYAAEWFAINSRTDQGTVVAPGFNTNQLHAVLTARTEADSLGIGVAQGVTGRTSGGVVNQKIKIGQNGAGALFPVDIHAILLWNQALPSTDWVALVDEAQALI